MGLAIWNFIGDPENREILSWLCGGITVVAGGVWATVKFFSKADPPRSPNRPENIVSARGGSIAVGRNVSGNINQIKRTNSDS
jgi:hypothetical protein